MDGTLGRLEEVFGAGLFAAVLLDVFLTVLYARMGTGLRSRRGRYPGRFRLAARRPEVRILANVADQGKYFRSRLSGMKLAEPASVRGSCSTSRPSPCYPEPAATHDRGLAVARVGLGGNDEGNDVLAGGEQ